MEQKLIILVVTLLCYSFSITSNYIMIFPVKEILFLGLLILCGIKIIKENMHINKECIFVILFLMIFLLFWGILGFINGYEKSVFQQAIKIITTIGIFELFLFILINNIISLDKMKRIINTMFFISIIFKIFLEGLYVFNIYDEKSLVDLIENIFKMEVMPMFIADGLLLRIGLIIDVLPLSIFPFLLMNSSKKKKIIIIIGIIMCIIINYSRIYMIQFVALMLVYVFTEINIKKINIKKILVGLFLGILVLSAYNIEGNIINSRFVGEDIEYSDLARVEQIAAFSKEIPDNFLLGKGLGAYMRELIRSEEMPFLYEVEWMALIYQFGFIGIIFMGVIFYYIIKRYHMSYLDKKIKYLFYINLLFLFVRSAVNPMLFASNTVIILVCLFVFSKEYFLRNDIVKNNKKNIEAN
ncbi:hypothetical protein [Megamonas hypermegale]|uniref:hypothetical protein n=1 Tax=Megamonas hypermegale TaxID=158847 RepID=UPI00195CA19C|nr:hypothetical protein [Megamonas hypermegale]MBM6761407.1 hypothetical protein [Megamonas hypermegale]